MRVLQRLAPHVKRVDVMHVSQLNFMAKDTKELGAVLVGLQHGDAIVCATRAVAPAGEQQPAPSIPDDAMRVDLLVPTR